MSRNLRSKVNEKPSAASPGTARRGGAAGGPTNMRQVNAGSFGSSAAAGGFGFGAFPEAVPETPAEVSERLRAERQIVLSELQLQAEDNATAEEIGFSLATEIGERACDLYIKMTYDEYANEYTALALWDEMMDAIGSFSQAVPAILPENSAFGANAYIDPTTNLSSAFGSARGRASGNDGGDDGKSSMVRKLLAPPGIRTDPETPPPKTKEEIEAAFASRLETNLLGGKTGLPAALSQQPASSALKSSSSSSASAGKGGASASANASPEAGGEPKKERRRVRLTVTEPEDEQQQQQKEQKEKEKEIKKDESSSSSTTAGAVAGGGIGAKKLSAREQLQLAVEDKLREEKQKKEQEILRSPLHAQVALAQLRFDMEPPSADDPSWIPDAPPPMMFCDLTARHAAALKLKTIDPAQLAGALALNLDAAALGNLNGTTALGGTAVFGAGGGGLGATVSGRLARSQTLALTPRKSVVGGPATTRPPSGTIASNRSSSGGPNNSGVTRPLSPTQLTLNEVSKDSVPIHILTHHLSMMASSRSPYLAKKGMSASGLSPSSNNSQRDQDQQQQQQQQYRILGDDGAPPDVDHDSHFGHHLHHHHHHHHPAQAQAQGNIRRGSGSDDPFEINPRIAIPEAEDHQSSSDFSSLEEDDDSQQSPSEVEVAQRLQLRQAQKTRNSTAFNTISNQLNELTNPKSSASNLQQPFSSASASAAASSPNANNINNTATNNNNTNIVVTSPAGLGDKNVVVDSRLGRVILVSNVEGGGAGVGGAGGGGGGGKKGARNANPLAEAPRFNVQMPAPPTTEPPTGSREARLARRVATLTSASSQGKSAPVSTTASPEKADRDQKQPAPQQSQRTSSRGGASSPLLGSQKKKRRRDNDPSNFFEPEAKIVPMVQLFNPSGGVVVKDDNGSRRNERPNQPTRMSRDDYKKMLRMGGASSNATGNGSGFNIAANEFGWNTTTSASANATNATATGSQAQTARSSQQQQAAPSSTSKTARR